MYGPEPREDLHPPPVPESEPSSSFTAPASTSTSIHETHIPPSAPSADLQTPPPVTEACASLSSDMDDLWSGILHIEPFFGSPASISPTAAVDTHLTVSSPHAPVKAYTRRPRGGQTDTSVSTSIPLVLPTGAAEDLGRHEPLEGGTHVDDVSASMATQAPADDAPEGEPDGEAVSSPLADIAGDVPMQPGRPRRARKRPRCGTE